MPLLDLPALQRYCLVRTGAIWYALPALSVREIAPRPPTVPVPLASRLPASICHFRNEFLTVLRLRDLAGDDSGEGREIQLVAMTEPQGQWGVLVEEVAALAVLETSPADSDDEVPGGNPIAGWSMFRGQAVRVLDPQALYRRAAFLLEAGWEGPGETHV